MAAQPIRIISKPGIKRDGTRLEGEFYIDAQWARWQRGRVRKIGGYLSVAQDLQELIYGIDSFSANTNHYLHLGSANQCQQRVLNSTGVSIGANDRTPAGLVGSPNNIWQFDEIFEAGAVGDTVLVAHAAPNMNIASTADRTIYYGVVTAAGILVASAQSPVSGGGLAVGPYFVTFGNGGLVQWSEENDITVPENGSANVTQQKLIVGKRIRGGGAPSSLLWSLDSLLQMTFRDVVGGVVEWAFDTISDDTSILSSRSVIEYDGVYLWPGVDRFLMYNGVVREVPNDMNINYFFDNLNFAMRQKVFVMKVPRFGEIWWCYPRGNATECTHAIIYNIRGNFWYDTQLPDQGRTDGLFAKVFNKPFMTGAQLNGGRYDLWQHEAGVDSIRLGDTQPIPSFFETHEFSLYEAEDAQQLENKSIKVSVLESDFVQAGALTLTVNGRTNARSTVYASDPVTIPETSTGPDDQVSYLKENRRLMSFKFSSNVVGGNYQMGNIVAHIEKTDSRYTQ